MQRRNTSKYYGIISRWLQWAIAVVPAWQFLTALTTKRARGAPDEPKPV